MDEHTSDDLKILVIDKDLRTITVPDDAKIFGVSGEVRVNRLQFMTPRYCCGFDLSEFKACIDYDNANGDKNYYDVEDITTEDEYVTFTWLLDPDVTAYAGTVQFAVRLLKLDGTKVLKRFKTEPAEGEVKEGMNIDTRVLQEDQNDILASLDFIKETMSEVKKDANVQQIQKNKENVAELTKTVKDNKTEFDEFEETTNNNIEDAATEISFLADSDYYRNRVPGISGPVVSFIDDDCRSETYTKLFPLIKELNIPYTVACPVAQLGTANYMTAEQLKEMTDSGVSVASHHLKQYNMNQFKTAEEYDDELTVCDLRFKELGIKTNAVCYPQGVYVDDYMSIVNKHYRCGFTIDRGVNDIPLESLFLKRIEVFPTTAIYTMDDVKKYVDNLKNGEWLVFMTHSWYETFSATDLKSLIQYIQGKSIEIVSVDEGLSRVGNLEEHGIIKKPLEYMSDPFYCVDKTGKVHTNTQKFYKRSNVKISRVTAGWNAGYNLTVNGSTPAVPSKSRLVSEKVAVTAGDAYLISASNIYGNALYVVYDSSDTVINYEAAENTAEGTVIKNKHVVMPDNASYIKVATNLAIQPESYEILKELPVTTNEELLDKTLTQEGVPADAKATGDAVTSLKEDIGDIDDVTFDTSVNLLNLEDTNFLLGSRYANYSAGSYIMTDSGYFVTGYIPCKKGDIVRVTYPNSATYANSIGVYDTNRKWLEGKKIGNNYSTKGEVEITNENAVYFRASISIANGKDTWKNICMITINNDMPSEFIECGKKTLRDNFNASDAYKTSKKNADLLDIEKDTFFFAPSEFYGIKGRLGRSRKIFIENLLVSHCLSDFYIISNTYNIYTHHDDSFLLFSDNGQSNVASIHRASNGEKIYKSPDMHFRAVDKSNVENPSDTKNVLMIGDSFTDGGYLPCEVKNILVNDLGLTKLNFVGHKTDTDGEVTCKNCGIGGITLQDYIKTDNTDGRGEGTWSNPFLFNGTISFKQYMQEYAEGANLDIAVIECGVNDLIALDSFDSEKDISKMKTMIDNIHSEYPECKIFVVGQKYANHVQTQLATYDWNVQVQKLNKGYFEICKDSNYSNYCTYVDIALMFDGLHFAPYEMKLLYKGSDETVRVITDWLHPNKAGYYAIAENIAGAIAYILFRKTL